MDHILQSWENSLRGGMQMTASICRMFSNTMSLSPLTKPWAEELKKYSSFLKEKNMRIESSQWMTPSRIVHRGLKVALRKFNGDEKGNPVLLVPPEAGHNSQIVDYGPEQSLVQCALDHFAGDVYVVEKLPAEPKDANYSIEDCIRSLDLCIQHIGKPVHLIGLCQGGWQSAIYTALFTERVKTLSLAGAPIDFHAGDSVISQWAQALPMSFFEAMVSMGSGTMPGSFIVTGFKLMNAADRYVGDDVKLFQNIDDPAFVDRHRRFNGWYQFTQPLAGRMYLEVVQQLFKENQLVKGQFKLMGRRVDLSRIYHPLHLIAGSKDDITLPEQLFALEKHVSSLIVEKHLAEAGHIGVFMGKNVIKDIWTALFKRLSSYNLADSFDVNIHLPAETHNGETQPL
ncbi:MAG: DUF3141 domain-containing protein [Desulfobacteraceae bacterium]|nr:DUF3141 domain-containing protein [Desulfobacteraceae bacterium]